MHCNVLHLHFTVRSEHLTPQGPQRDRHLPSAPYSASRFGPNTRRRDLHNSILAMLILSHPRAAGQRCSHGGLSNGHLLRGHLHVLQAFLSQA